MITVCVIGAGPVGLTAAKNFLEEGFDVTGVESRDWIGGLWKASGDAHLSAHSKTVFNSSKWVSPYSDFPFGDEIDNFPTREQVYDYLQDYADHFRVRERYRLGTKAARVEFDVEKTKWAVTLLEISTSKTQTEYFDKVCISTGAFHSPRTPQIEDIEQFQGRTLHAIEFSDGREFEFQSQNVLIVGLHHSASDVCNALSAASAKHVYLSHRQGVLMLPRYLADGSIMDTSTTVKGAFAIAFLNRYFNSLWNWILQRMLVSISKAAFSPMLESLNPPPPMAVHVPTVGDPLWPLLNSDFTDIVPSIRRIAGPRQVELSNGQVLDDINAIIYCTGYEFSLPDGLFPRVADKDTENSFLDPYTHSKNADDPPLLYRNIFPMHENEAIRNSLALIGHGYILFSGFVQFELCAMSVAQIWAGKSALPSWPGMQAWRTKHLQNREHLRKKYKPLRGSTFYPGGLDYTDHLQWWDHTAGTGLYDNLGGVTGGWFNWRVWKLWWNDYQFYKVLTSGFFSPLIWRMFDTGKRRALDWETGRAMILRENESAKQAQLARVQELAAKKTN